MAVIARCEVTLAVAVDVASVTTWYRIQPSVSQPPAKPDEEVPNGWSPDEPAYDGATTVPLPPQPAAAYEDRRAAGNQVQVKAFGERIRESWTRGPEERRHISLWLAENCFGDYYTRAGLSLPQREMITFCFLAAQGGCEPQLVAHAKGNFHVGNDRFFLIQVVSQCLPYIGYPRSLNALDCIDKA